MIEPNSPELPVFPLMFAEQLFPPEEFTVPHPTAPIIKGVLKPEGGTWA